MIRINLAPPEKKKSLREAISILPYAEFEKLPDNEQLEIVGSPHYESNVAWLTVRDGSKQYYEVPTPVSLNSSTTNPLVKTVSEEKLEELVRQEPIRAEVKTLRQLAEGHYLLSDVLKHPWKAYLKGVREEFCRDTALFKKRDIKKLLLEDLLTLLSFGIISVPHELMHAGMNTLTGGVNKEIVINRLYGGDLAAKLIPGVKSDWLFPLIGGYVKPECISELAKIATLATPYLLTPLGFYCIMKGKEKKNSPLTFLGMGALAGHLGGVIGDFFTTGRALVIDGINFISPESTYESSSWLYAPVIAGGFYIGLKAMRFTYRLSKGFMNSVLEYSYQKKQEGKDLGSRVRNYFS